MSDYIIFYQRPPYKKVNISIDDLNDPSSSCNRRELLELQRRNEATLYCACNRGSLIRMTLTSHNPTPHIISSSRADGMRHFEFCRHFISNEGTSPEIFKGGPQKDESTGMEYARVDLFGKDKDDSVDLCPQREFYQGTQSIHYKSIMSLYDFVKYLNFTYFPVFQTRKGKLLENYLDSLWAKISHFYVGSKATSADELGKVLSKNGLCYMQKLIYGTEPYLKKDGTESKKQFYIITHTQGRKKLINTAAFEKAKERFKERYGFYAEPLLSSCNPDFPLLLFGIVNDNDIYDKSTYYELALVNRYGVICDSITEAQALNGICDFVLKDKVYKDKYFVRRPFYPENVYDKHPEFIPDIIIESREYGKKIVFEVFSNDNDEDFIERRYIKVQSCKIAHVFYDITPPMNDSLFDSIERLRELLK